MFQNHHNAEVRIIPLICWLIALLAVVAMNALAQIASVKGVVSASTLSVRYASVTFVDQGDTTKRFSVLTDTAGRYSLSVATSVTQPETRPAKFELGQNYPNPFSSSTAIPYQLGTPAEVVVTVYDILGREIRTFSLGEQSAGAHGVLWDGRNNMGTLVATGTYFCRLQAKGETHIRKMIFNNGGRSIVNAPVIVHNAETLNISTSAASALMGANFSVRIANTDSTFPPILYQQFDNVLVQSAASTNFTVSTDGTFPDRASAVIYSDPEQTIRGFGGANIIGPGWRPDMTTSQVQTAFGNGPGQLGFSILRLRVPPDTVATPLSIEVPTARLAESLGAIVFATPWTPPASMKSNNNLVGGSLNASAYGAFAGYLKRFADYMSANGAPLYAISVQNEPDANVTYESCSWTGAQYLSFMKNNAPSIGIRVIMPESENFNHSFSDPTLNDSTAAANTSIIGGHLYGGGLGSYPLATNLGKDFWMTEYLDLDTTWAGTSGTLSTGVLSTGKQISDCMKAGMNAYVTWYTIRYYGPINEAGIVTKRGYVMSQFAKFVRPGFNKVRSIDYSARSLIDVTAYRSGSKLVLVVVNRNPAGTSQTFVLWNGTVGTFTPYVTSSSKNCEQQSAVTFKNGTFSYTLAPLSVTTFVLN
jgi:glucuronoarabinoxylan endo-1,4-beta-xylanase